MGKLYCYDDEIIKWTCRRQPVLLTYSARQDVADNKTLVWLDDHGIP